MAWFNRWLASSLALWLVCIAISAARGEDPDLATILHHREMWRDAVANLRLVCELRRRNDPDGDGPQPCPAKPVEDAIPFIVDEWIWADQGLAYHHFRHRTFFDTGRSAESRTIAAWNAPDNLSFTARYHREPDEEERFETLTVNGAPAGKPVPVSRPMPLTGLYFCGDGWLGEVLLNPAWGWQVKGLESLGPHRCVRLLASRDGAVLWLDRDHDFLPRRYLARHVCRTSGDPEQAPGWDTTVEEFQKLAAGIWFPKRGVHLNFHNPNAPPEIIDWVFAEVDVNAELPRAKFAAPTPEIGTTVEDWLSGARYRVANEADRSKLAASLAERAKVNDPNSMPKATGRGPSLSSLYFLASALVVSVVMIDAAVRMLRGKITGRAGT